ncbi:MAG: hypothetical protein HY820_10995 [Acidobacteria bacterium]|nr:hypothetical protein [Acidobacteriota bacterium]
MSENENYLGRLISAVTGSSGISGVSATSLIRTVTGTSSSRSTSSTGAATTALRIGSSLLGSSVASAVATKGSAGVASLLGASGSPLGLLASFIGGLFGGGSEPVAAKPQKYQSATPVQYDFGLTGNGGGFQAVDSGVTGMSRAVSGNSGGSREVVIQVNAMDSRSFMDHSNEIAEAVRKALLDSHPLRDVMTE